MNNMILLCIVWVVTIQCNLLAQSYDKNWLIGDGINGVSDTPFAGLGLMIFDQSGFRFERLNNNNYLNLSYSFARSNISDINGNFLCFTNGCKILNRSCRVMQNGDTINPGRVWFGHDGFYYPSVNGTLFLPDPIDKNIYYLFHKRVTFNDDPPDFTDRLFLSIIDASKDNGLGAVLSKNQPIISDTLNDSQLAACRHANGRDWWIPIRHGVHNLYYMLLLGPDGVQIHHTQRIGIHGQGYDETFTGNAMFSPDGRLYVSCTRRDKVQLFEFDRCSGYFDNPIQLIPADSMEQATSVCFSPDGSKLYFNDIFRLWQYDLTARDIAKTQQLIAVWDTFTYANCCPTAFFQMRLAPDDKIYMSIFGSSNIYLHRIRYPNRKGAECEFVQRDITLPNWHDGCLPYFPNYRLGPVIGSECDSIYRIRPEADIGIGPNPLSDRLFIYTNASYPFELDMYLEIYSLNGKLVSRHQLKNQSNRHQLDLSELPAAVYVYHLEINRDAALTGKLVKI